MGAELPLTCLLLALAIILIISVIVLAMHVDRLKRSVAVLGSNPVNLIELRHRDSNPPKIPPPRPISGTCPWLKASMESVVLVPSRRESLKEVFLEDESVFVANIAACGTFELPVDN